MKVLELNPKKKKERCMTSAHTQSSQSMRSNNLAAEAP